MARYWVGGGSSANWSATGNTNWSATDGGANNASVPTSTDDVIFNGNGASANSNSTISATITVLSLTVTAGYTATMTHNGVVQINGNWTMHTGYTIAGSSAININATSTITSSGKTWPNALNFTSGGTTKTFVGDFTCLGLLTVTNSTQTLNKTTSEKLNLNSFTINASITGTIDIWLKGGTISGAGNLGCAITFDGTVTVSGTLTPVDNSFTYNSGTITTTGSTLNITGATATFNTNGMSWENISITAGTSPKTLTINSLLTLTGTFTIGQINVTFAGTAGFTVPTFSITATTVQTTSFKESVTYTITQLFSAYQSRLGSIVLFTSSHASTKANILMPNNGNNSCNILASFTRIDATGGRTINSYGGTITDCVNIQSYTDRKTVALA